MPTEIQLALQNRRSRRRLPRPPRLPSTLPIERAYRNELYKIVDQITREIDGRLVPELGAMERSIPRVNLDAWDDSLEQIMGNVRRVSQVPKNYAERLAQKYGEETSRTNMRGIRAQMKTILSVDMAFNDRNTQQILKSFTRANVDFIESIQTRYYREVEGIVGNAFRSGTRAEDIEAKIIDKIDLRGEVAKSRAALIARDQINKLNGNITQERQTSIGIKEYIWRTAMDERVRQTHQDHEGKTYSWSDPPANTGHPGFDYQCRCYAEPVIPGGLFDE